MICGQGTRRVTESNRISWRSSICSRMCSSQQASWCGRWSNSRRMTRLLPAASIAAADERVERVVICTPDKDLAQGVQGTRVVQFNRRTRVTMDESGVVKKYGVSPCSIPDYLALVGDSADGYPGLPGWGAKSAAAVLSKFVHLEAIPTDWREWRVNAVNAASLSAMLSRQLDLALLFRRIATLRCDITLFNDVDELRWRGSKPGFEEIASVLDTAKTVPKANRTSA